MPEDRPLVGTAHVESVSAERMKALAFLVEDGNPIHLYPDAVVAAGLGDKVINPGSANLGYLLNALLAIDPRAQLEKVSLTLMGNVLAGDEVVAEARLAGEEADGDGRRLTCDVTLDVSGGARAIQGTAIVRVPDGAS